MRHSAIATHSTPSLPILVLPLLAFFAACDESVSVLAEVKADVPDAAAEPSAWFELERDSHDFGEVYSGALRQTTFELVAAGSEPLVVNSLRRDCGCLEGELFVLDDTGAGSPVEVGVPYAPDTRFEITATLNTLGRHGLQAQRVQIITQGDQLTTLTLAADVVTFLEFDAAVLELPKFRTHEGLERKLQVWSRGNERFLLDARRDVLPDDLELEFAPLEPDGDGRSDRWEMSFRILPGAPMGTYARKVILTTDAVNEEARPSSDGSTPTHMGEIWIRTEVEGVFHVWPGRLDFGTMHADRTKAKKVVIKNYDQGFDMAGLEVALFASSGADFPHRDAFEITARPIEPGRTWEIEIRAQGYPLAGSFDGIIGIKLDHPFQSYVEVPFIGWAAELD